MSIEFNNYNGYTPRQENLINLLIENGDLTYDFLADELGVSVMTIRRDVQKLLNNNIVKKSKPGFIGMKTSFEVDPGYEKRHSSNLNEKVAIAYEASKLISSGMSIGLDGSTTTIELSKLLSVYSPLRVITNSILIPHYFNGNPDVDINISGGIFRHDAFSMVGQAACDAIGKYHCDYAFFSSNAFDLKHGLTDFSEQEIYTKLKFMENADKTVALIDSSKFNTISYCFCCDISDIDILITDNKVKKEDVKYIEKLGVRVIVAEA